MRKVLALGMLIVATTTLASCGGSSNTTATSASQLPWVVGKDVQDAKAILIDAGYKVAVEPLYSQSKPGKVVRQSPSGLLSPGVPKASTVTLKESRGVAPPTPFRANIVPHKRADFEVQGFDIYPVTNEVRIANNHKLVRVFAGVPPGHHSTGRLIVVRNGPDNVDIPGAGAVKITGVNVVPEVTPRPEGDVEFASANGITGILHLADDTVTTTGG